MVASGVRNDLHTLSYSKKYANVIHQNNQLIFNDLSIQITIRPPGMLHTATPKLVQKQNSLGRALHIATSLCKMQHPTRRVMVAIINGPGRHRSRTGQISDDWSHQNKKSGL